MKCGQLNSLLFCKPASKYNAYGIKQQEADESKLFPTNKVETGDSVTHNERTTNLDSGTTHAITIQQHMPQPTAQTKPEEIIALFLSGMCSMDMLTENFIASVMTGYQLTNKTETAQILMVPIFINTLCMTYSQYKLVINGFKRARGQTVGSSDLNQDATTANQMQALAGFLSSVETGIRFFFNVMVMFNEPNKTLKYLVAYAAGASKFGSFLMASGHAVCDVPLGKTLVGKLVYGFLSSPIAPDFIHYVTNVSPLIEGIVFYSSVTTIKDMIGVENKAISAIFYSLALFSGITAFLYQKCFICAVIKQNVIKNELTMKSFNKFWYGEAVNANKLQQLCYAIKRLIDIIMALPLTACYAGDKALDACCYLLLAVLPIQIIAMSQYISQSALAYAVFYQIFNNTQGLIKTYTGKETQQLSPETQYLATLVAIPFGLAAAFTILNLMGGKVLEATDKVYNRSITAEATINSNEATLLVDTDSSSQGITMIGRLRNVANYSKDLVRDVVREMVAQVKGRQVY